jgi:hypothetical protein
MVEKQRQKAGVSYPLGQAPMIERVKETIRAIRDYLRLPEEAKAEYRRDLRGVPRNDPGIELALDESAAWIGVAQDNSRSGDGGVARHFSLVSGWGSSYPETTGYIIPTILEYGKLRGDDNSRERARRMLDWLVSIQLNDGGFQGGTIDSKPVTPVAFNTGQILLGLASGVREFGSDYLEPMSRAADWLVSSQDPNGNWRKFPSPFAASGEKTYETHVAWGLLEAARINQDSSYVKAALANVHWALGFQHDNGWFEKCCLEDPTQPLTHTLGYVLRGIIEAFRFTEDEALFNSCVKTADGLLKTMREDGFLAGRLDRNWRGTVRWNCLTGSLQIACCWLILYQYTGNSRYRDAAYKTNRYVRCTMKVDKPSETRGAIKGSFPVYGKYCTHEYPNWACKFFLDSNMMEKAARQE